jgi:hypothetical protein
VLAAVGIQNVRTSIQVTPGTAYVCPEGVAGLIGFEATPYGATTAAQPGVGITSGGQAGLVTEIIPSHPAVFWRATPLDLRRRTSRLFYTRGEKFQAQQTIWPTTDFTHA